MASESQCMFYVGEKFSSTVEFNDKLKLFETETKCSFVFKSTTKSETDNKRRKRPICVDRFVLARGTVVCAHFGTKRTHPHVPSKKVKTATKSQKLQCSASFSFKYQDYMQCLVVTKCQLEHSHATTELTYAQQHKQKQFSDEEKSVLREVAALNPDNEKFLIMVQKEFQKSLCLKDIRALKSKLKNERKDSVVVAVTKQLKAIDESSGTFKLLLSTDKGTSDQHLIDVVAFCSKGMIACFKSFPECIFIDGTYKKNSSGYPLYQIMVQDSLGAARPVFYAFIRNETRATLTMVLQTFAEFVGGDIKKTCIVMSDKCSSEASAIRTVLPWARHLLCHWHVYAAMEKKVKSLRSLDKKQKNALSLLHIRLRNTADPAQFAQIEIEIETLSPDFFMYYMQQWSTCKEQWAACDRLNAVNFLNDTNNFVESENCRLGKVLSSSKNIASSLYHLNNHGIVHMNELSQSVVRESMCNITYQNAHSDLVHLYDQFYPYAAKAMIIDHKHIANVLVASPSDNIFHATESSGARFKVTVGENNLASCHCPFSVQMTLPCVHVMACHLSGMSAQVYDPNNRWLRSRGYVVSSGQHTGYAVVRECVPVERRHYQTEALLAQVSNELKNSGGAQFEKKRQAVAKMLSLWQEGKDVAVGEDVGGGEVVVGGGDVVGGAEDNVAGGSSVVVGIQTNVSLQDACNLNVHIPTIRARGRPAKPRTTKRKAKRARNIFIDENICYFCLNSDLDKSKSNVQVMIPGHDALFASGAIMTCVLVRQVEFNPNMFVNIISTYVLYSNICVVVCRDTGDEIVSAIKIDAHEFHS